jgi:hypothetical protein
MESNENFAKKLQAEEYSRFVFTPPPAPVSTVSAANALVPGHVGIENCGNSCFMNAILQMLYNTYEFRTGLLALTEEERVSEPYLTLYNIFSRLEEAKRNRTKFIQIDDLLTYLFECSTTYSEETYAASSEQAEIKRNKKFKQLGVERGYFTEENLKRYSNPSFDERIRKAFLDEKLERNIAGINSRATEAEKKAQEQKLRNAQEAAVTNLTASLGEYTGRRQQDAGDFLTDCILYKKRNHNLVKLFTCNDVKVTTGLFNEADLPENRKTALFTITDEDNLPQTIYNLGLVDDGRRKKMTAVLTPERSIGTQLDLTRRDLPERGEIDLQDLITPELREVESRGLNIPKVGEVLSKTQRSGEFRFTPTNIQQKDGFFFPPEQKYWITTIKRFIHNWETDTRIKNDRKIKLNKQITIDNTIIKEDGFSVERVTFELVGMVMHGGGVSGGHYWYMWKDPCSKTWIEFNDSIVSYHKNIKDDTYIRLSTASDIEKKAYILLWKRKTGGPFPAIEALRRQYATAAPVPPPAPTREAPPPPAPTREETPPPAPTREAPPPPPAQTNKPPPSAPISQKSKEEIKDLLDRANRTKNNEELFQIIKELSPSSTIQIDGRQVGKRGEKIRKLFGIDSKYLTRLVNEWNGDRVGKGDGVGHKFFFRSPMPVQGFTRTKYAENKKSMKGGKRKTRRKNRNDTKQ